MKLSVLFVCLLSAVAAFAQGGAVTAVPTITNTRGEPVPYAQVSVCSSNPGSLPSTVCNGNFATIYTDVTIATPCQNNITPIKSISGTGCTNPGKSDGLGNVIAYAAAGQYWCEYSGGSISRPLVVPCFFANGGSANLNCPAALNGSIGAFTAPTSFSCDPNFSTDFKGNFQAQSGQFIGPVNGFLGVIGGGLDPGTNVKYKLGANEFRWLGNTLTTPFYGRVPPTHCAVGQVWDVIASTTDANGDIIDTFGCLTPAGNASHPTMNNPSAPTVTPGGVTGSTTYSYQIVICEDGPTCANHTLPSAAGTTATGNATLSSSNYNQLSGYVDSYVGQFGRCVNIYRTAGGATQGLIANCAWKMFRDTGLAGDGTTPVATNTTTLDENGTTAPLPGCNKIWAAPWGVDTLPCTPNVLDSEFTSTFGSPGDVNDGTWTWLNQNSATATLTNGIMRLTAPSRAGSTNINCLESNTLPASPYTFVVALYSNISDVGAHQNTWHVGFYETSTAKLETIAQQNTSTNNVRVYLSENSAFTTDAQTTLGENGYPIPSPVYVQISNDGANLSFYTSADGISYTKQFTTTKTAFFTTGPTNAIVCIDNIASGAAGNFSVDFDYFRRTQ